MITQKDIDRINELYRKSKAEGLTEDEALEQKALRKLTLQLSVIICEELLRQLRFRIPTEALLM